MRSRRGRRDQSGVSCETLWRRVYRPLAVSRNLVYRRYCFGVKSCRPYGAMCQRRSRELQCHTFTFKRLKDPLGQTHVPRRHARGKMNSYEDELVRGPASSGAFGAFRYGQVAYMEPAHRKYGQRRADCLTEHLKCRPHRKSSSPVSAQPAGPSQLPYAAACREPPGAERRHHAPDPLKAP